MPEIGNDCPECNGSGIISAQNCSHCDGKGQIIVHSLSHDHGGRPHGHPHPHPEPHHPMDRSVYDHRHNR